MCNYVPVGDLIQSHPDQCPKYQSCNANICPLDTECLHRVHLPGETVCYFLLEAQKVNAKHHFQGCMELKIYWATCVLAEPLKCIYAPLKKQLGRAGRTPSRMRVKEDG